MKKQNQKFWMATLSLLMIMSCSGEADRLSPSADKVTETTIAGSVSETCGESSGETVSNVYENKVVIKPNTICEEPPVIALPHPDPEVVLTTANCSTKDLYDRVPSDVHFAASFRYVDLKKSLFGAHILEYYPLFKKQQTVVEGRINEALKIFDRHLDDIESTGVLGHLDTVLLDDQKKVTEDRVSVGVLFKFYTEMSQERFDSLKISLPEEFKKALVIEDSQGTGEVTFSNLLSTDNEFRFVVAGSFDGKTEEGSDLECVLEKKYMTCAYSTKTTAGEYLNGLLDVRDGKLASIDTSHQLSEMGECDTLQLYFESKVINEGIQSENTSTDADDEKEVQTAENEPFTDLWLGNDLFLTANAFPAQLEGEELLFGYLRIAASVYNGGKWQARLLFEMSEWMAKSYLDLLDLANEQQLQQVEHQQ